VVADLLASPRWTAEIPWFFVSRSRPLLGDDVVVARCGRAVVTLDRGTGKHRREHVLDPPAANETFLLPCDGGWLTDIHRQPAGLTTVLSLGRDGATHWRADLPAIIGSRGGILVGRRLVLPAKQPKSGQRLIVFESPAELGVFTNIALDRGISRLVAAGDARIVVANAMAEDRGSGLYAIGLDGSDPVVLAAAPAVDIAAGPDRVVAVLRECEGPTVAAFDVASATCVWEASVSAEVVAASGQTVCTIEDGMPVCRLLNDGDVVWRAPPISVKVTSAAIAGGLLFLGHDHGREVLALDDGATLGALGPGLGPVALDATAMYVVARRAVICAAHPCPGQ
jgi:hypothetical protein